MFITTDIARLISKYVAMMMRNIGIAWPVLLMIVRLTLTSSGKAIAIARLEFFVRLRYWLVRGGTGGYGAGLRHQGNAQPLGKGQIGLGR